MNSLFALMLVPLLIWVAVWGYLWNLDGKVRRLQNEILQNELGREEDE